MDGDLSDPRVRRSSSPRRGAVSPSLLAAKTTELEPSVKATAMQHSFCKASLISKGVRRHARRDGPVTIKSREGRTSPPSSLARKSRVLVNRNGCEPPLNPA